MVRHHAPCVHPVFGQIEMSQRFSDNLRNPWISKKASASASIQLRLDLFAEEFFESSLIRRRKRGSAGLLRGSEDILTLSFEFLQDGSRKRIGKTKMTK